MNGRPRGRWTPFKTPLPSWVVIALAIAALAILGALLACTLAGRPGYWAPVMGAGGVAVTWIGNWLHIA
ncbi:hypothetical protein [Streptomyces niveus]|uniref:hypothetical protein n=1 Tax=Streptomyces niveus TaxID=193462 RepID=UPI0034190267